MITVTTFDYVASHFAVALVCGVLAYLVGSIVTWLGVIEQIEDALDSKK